MLTTVAATRFIKKMGSGRTQPCLLECEDAEGNLKEVVVKYSDGLIEKEKALAMEAVVAMLAADLRLPVAEPFVVELASAFIATISDETLRSKFAKSCSLAFGSDYRSGFAAWPKDHNIPAELSECAAEIMIFDEIIENWDRRPENPNCMYASNQLLIIDHELAFQRLLFWQEPWLDGGLKELDVKGHHIFAGPYFDSLPANFDRFVAAWEAIPDERFDAYKTALPPTWVYDETHLDGILSYLKSAKANIRIITANALKVLK